jgi:chaperonin GroES
VTERQLKSQIRAVLDRVIIQPFETEIMGIQIPGVAQEKPHRGIVLSIGPAERHPNGKRISEVVRRGDIVHFHPVKSAWLDLGKFGGEKLVVTAIGDLVGIEEAEPKPAAKSRQKES